MCGANGVPVLGTEASGAACWASEERLRARVQMNEPLSNGHLQLLCSLAGAPHAGTPLALLGGYKGTGLL